MRDVLFMQIMHHVDGKLISVSKKSNCCGEENGKEGSFKAVKFVEQKLVWSENK